MNDLKEQRKSLRDKISTIEGQIDFYYSKIRELEKELNELRQDELLVKVKLSFEDFRRGAK